MTPNTLYNADVLETLREWPDGCCDMAITSPPYWGLRAYLPKDHADKSKELGSEKTIEEYIQNQVAVFREVRRVLRPWGTLWVNIANSMPDGQVLPQAWILGLALQNDGWILRSIIIWLKAWSFHDCGAGQPIEIVENGLWGEEYRQTIEPDEHNYVGSTMPESVSGWAWRRHRIKIKDEPERTEAGQLEGFRKHSGYAIQGPQFIDCPGCPKCEANGGLVLRKGAGRPTKAHEYLFLFSKSPQYYYDNEAVRELNAEPWRSGSNESKNPHNAPKESMAIQWTPGTRHYNPSGRNLRDCWCINPQPSKEKHYATFPEKLVEPCIKAGTSQVGNCPACGMPWARIMQASPDYAKKLGTWTPDTDADKNLRANIGFAANAKKEACCSDYQTLGWKASCNCNAGEPVPAVVLDPYIGAGTTAVVAERLGRNWLGIELNAAYVAIGGRRIGKEKKLL